MINNTGKETRTGSTFSDPAYVIYNMLKARKAGLL